MKIICVGRNYAAHAHELKSEVPTEPVIFLKPDTAQLKGKNVFYLPDFSSSIEHELELVFKVCKEGKHIQEKYAMKYVDEVSVGIDFTARELQNKLKNKGLPWELSKAFDASAPAGHFLPLKKFDPQSIAFHLLLNGKTVQSGNSKNMLFPVSKIISFVSTFITLRKGDQIFTGTPEGVGKVAKGDVLQAFLEDEKLLEVKVA